MWRPPPESQPVSKKEIIGRRLFGDWRADKERGEISGKPKWGVFVESRVGHNLSMDRLGVRTADLDVERHLLSLCERHATMTKKPFAGWAKLQVEELTLKPLNLGVKPTPIKEPPEDRNPYHADVETGALNAADRNYVAFVMAQRCAVPDSTTFPKNRVVSALVQRFVTLMARLKFDRRRD